MIDVVYDGQCGFCVRALARLRMGQVIREVGPAHQAKAGTPTMGGLLILSSLIVSVLLWSNLDERGVWILLGLTIGYGDLAPKTLLARTLAILIGVCGVLFTALLAAVAVKALGAASEDGNQ